MSVSQNIERVKSDINEACIKAGRNLRTVRLMAVSKFHPLDLVLEAQKAGLHLFGESRVQEASAKFGTEKINLTGIELHLIGTLQRNKAKKAVLLFDCVQSVDRIELVEELGMLTEGRKTPLKIMLELNAGEEAKSGFPDEDVLLRGAEKLMGFSGLKAVGLMTMAPWTDDDVKVRHAFSKLVKVQRNLQTHFPAADWSCLSMGMSGDFKIAIEEGSTLVRIGTAIFGERSP